MYSTSKGFYDLYYTNDRTCVTIIDECIINYTYRKGSFSNSETLVDTNGNIIHLDQVMKALLANNPVILEEAKRTNPNVEKDLTLDKFNNI